MKRPSAKIWWPYRRQKGRIEENRKKRVQLQSENAVKIPNTLIRHAVPNAGSFNVLDIQRFGDDFLLTVMFANGTAKFRDRVDEFPSELLLAKIMLMAG
jgi:hypothetical protein